MVLANLGFNARKSLMREVITRIVQTSSAKSLTKNPFISIIDDSYKDDTSTFQTVRFMRKSNHRGLRWMRQRISGRRLRSHAKSTRNMHAGTYARHALHSQRPRCAVATVEGWCVDNARDSRYCRESSMRFGDYDGSRGARG